MMLGISREETDQAKSFRKNLILKEQPKNTTKLGAFGFY